MKNLAPTLAPPTMPVTPGELKTRYQKALFRLRLERLLLVIGLTIALAALCIGFSREWQPSVMAIPIGGAIFLGFFLVMHLTVKGMGFEVAWQEQFKQKRK